MAVGTLPSPVLDYEIDYYRELANYLCAIGVKATGALGVYLGGDGPVEAAIVLTNPRRKLKAA